ncbi:MAG: lactonase family protein [Gemmatimonadetes bacterium]|jgi:6-phosphogluconolactonase|nr:lactonase family protein [Gemmatimonadota bacterium]
MADELLVYVGTYTRRGSEGVYVYRLDMGTGALMQVGAGAGVENPSFLAIAPDKKHLYAVGEVGEFNGKESGAVGAFAIDQESGELTFLNQQASEGNGPCHISIDQNGKYALVANYGGGSVSILPIQEDGSLGEASDFVQHEGGSVDEGRQKGPHAHSINVDPTNQFAFAADLGLDQVLCYRIEGGKLPPNEPPFTAVAGGEGPRHFDFHPSGKFAYLITEMGNKVVAFNYDSAKGTLEEIQMISTLPEGWEGTSYCADVHVSPDGRFLYGSNRGHDSIAIYAIDQATGMLSLVDIAPCGGKNPRGFGIDPSGTFLLAGGQDTDNITIFRIDAESGRIEPTGEVSVPMPVCVKMVEL